MAWNPKRLGQSFLDDQEYDPSMEDLSVADRIALENGDNPPEAPPQVPQAPPQLPPNPGMPPGALPPNPGPPPGPSRPTVMQGNPEPNTYPAGPVPQSPIGEMRGAPPNPQRMPPNPGSPPGMAPPDNSTTNIQVPGQGPLPPQGLGTGSMGTGAAMPPAYQLPPVPQPGAYTFSGDKQIQHPSVLRRIGGALLGYASGEGIPGMVRGAIRPGYEQAVQRAGMQAGATERQAKLNKEAADIEEQQTKSGLYAQQTKTLAEEGKQKRYVPFGNGGIMDERTGEVLQQPPNMSANDWIEVSPEKAKSIGLMPLTPQRTQEIGLPARPGGTFALPKEGVGPFLTGSMHQPQEGELPLGPKAGQFNQILGQRYQVLHPGQPLPPAYTLTEQSTQKDYDRVAQGLGGAEAAEGTNVQRGIANQAHADSQAALNAQRDIANADREEKQGLKWVVGAHPETGEQVAAPISEAKKMNLQGLAELPQAETQKVMAARHWLPLAEKQGGTPDKMGILQLIDQLDKRGALGPIASRWNEFMVGKFGGGTGNPETDRLISALRTKLKLSKTLLMNLHVGNRGGAYLLEGFEDLANSGKMNANLLREGVSSELDYARDRAMMPPAAAPKAGTQPPRGTAAPLPNPRPQAGAPSQNPNPNGYVVGHKYGGLTYLGGDPNNPGSWKQ